MQTNGGSRESKHGTLNTAVGRLREASVLLEELSIKVRDGQAPPCKEQEKPESQASLGVTLEAVPKELDAIRDSIVTSIGELEGSLF